MVSGEPGSESRSEKGKILLVGVIIVIIIIVIYTLVTGGTASLSELFARILKYVIILAAFGLVVWIILKILQKPKTDLVAADKRAIIEAAMLSKPPMLRDLYFTGDKEHGEFRVGKITGYCQLMSYKDLNKISSLTPDELVELEKKGIEPSQFIIKEDCFVFKKFGFPFSLFEQPKVLRTLENEHSQLIGDVKIYAVSMLSKYNYFWPNRGHLDIARIDLDVIREAWRGQIHEFLKDMVAISQRSVGMDAEHRKGLESRKLLKIPSPLGEQESRNQ